MDNDLKLIDLCRYTLRRAMCDDGEEMEPKDGH